MKNVCAFKYEPEIGQCLQQQQRKVSFSDLSAAWPEHLTLGTDMRALHSLARVVIMTPWDGLPVDAEYYRLFPCTHNHNK